MPATTDSVPAAAAVELGKGWKGGGGQHKTKKKGGGGGEAAEIGGPPYQIMSMAARADSAPSPL